jgi:hypothetical protein
MTNKPYQNNTNFCSDEPQRHKAPDRTPKKSIFKISTTKSTTQTIINLKDFPLDILCYPILNLLDLYETYILRFVCKSKHFIVHRVSILNKNHFDLYDAVEARIIIPGKMSFVYIYSQ